MRYDAMSFATNKSTTFNEKSSKSKTKRKSDSISTSSNNSTGFKNTNDCLRSIFIHPMGVLLTTLLNETPPPLMPDDFWVELHKEMNKDELLTYKSYQTDLDYVLAAAVLQWDGNNETQLTNKIHSYMNAICNHKRVDGYVGDKRSVNQTENALIFEREKYTSKDQNGAGRVDFIITKQSSDVNNNNSTKKSIVAIVEVGTDSNNWWRKQHQILKYVTAIRAATAENSDFIFDQPILLVVMTVTKDNNNNKDSEGIKSQEIDETNKDLGEFDEQKSKIEMMDFGNDTISFRCGVFLCTPKETIDSRIALLWRTETKCLKAASQQFGKVLYAANICAQYRERFADMVKYKFQYLGPNCCKIGNSVSVFFIFTIVLLKVTFRSNYLWFHI